MRKRKKSIWKYGNKKDNYFFILDFISACEKCAKNFDVDIREIMLCIAEQIEELQ